MICTLCGRRAEEVHKTCLAAVHRGLQQIPVLYAMLTEALVPGNWAGPQVSGTHAAIPIMVDPLSLQCRGGIIAILASWETDWRSRRGLAAIPARAGHEHQLDGARVLGVIIGFLRAHLEWAARNHPAVDEFAQEVREIIGACRAALGLTTDMRRIGRCPAELGERTCGRVLYADPYADVIRCDRCHTEWPRKWWLKLGQILAGDAA